MDPATPDFPDHDARATESLEVRRRRGEVLVQVIALAEQLPARHTAQLHYPVLAELLDRRNR